MSTTRWGRKVKAKQTIQLHQGQLFFSKEKEELPSSPFCRLYTVDRKCWVLAKKLCDKSPQVHVTWYFTGACLAGSTELLTGGEYTPIQSSYPGEGTPLHDTLTHDPDDSNTDVFTSITISISEGRETHLGVQEFCICTTWGLKSMACV